MFKDYKFDDPKKTFIYKNLSFDPAKETINDLLVINSIKFSNDIGKYFDKLYEDFAGVNVGGDFHFANSTEIADVAFLSFSEAFSAKLGGLNSNNFLYKEIDYITQSADYALFSETSFVGSVIRFLQKFFFEQKPQVRPIEAADNPDWDTRFACLSAPVSQIDFDKRFSMEITYDRYGSVSRLNDCFRALTPHETSLLAVTLYNEFPGRFVLEWNMLVYEYLKDGEHKALMGELYLVPVFVSVEKRKSSRTLDIYG